MSETEGEWLDPVRPKLHVHPKPDLYSLPDTERYDGRRWRCSCGTVFIIESGYGQRDGEWYTWTEMGRLTSWRL